MMVINTPPQTNFFTLPRELRQMILLLTSQPRTQIYYYNGWRKRPAYHVEITPFMINRSLVQDWVRILYQVLPGNLRWEEDVEYCVKIWYQELKAAQESDNNLQQRLLGWRC